MGLTTGNSVVLTGLAIELDIANPKSYAVFGGAKGYYLGGYSGSVAATADKLTYSNDTTAAQTTANLSVSRYEMRGLSEGNTKGYTCGGYSSARVTTTDITFYPSDVTTTINSATLSLARNDYAGLSTYVNKGYIAGGATNSAYTNSIEFLYYSNNISAAQTTVTLSVTRGSIGSISQPNVQGYLAGGNTSSVTFYATTDKIFYSTDSCSAQTTANLSTVRIQPAGISECQTKGFWAGGWSSSASVVATVDKITFSTDTTVSQTTSNISTARSAGGSPTQGSSKGYVLGGYTTFAGAASAVSDKILFTTETMAAQSSANLSTARGSGASLDNIYSQTISDIAGGVNNATINNFTTYSRENGGCLIFSSNVNSQNTATIAANSSYAFGTGDFAYEVWINGSNFASGNNYILDLGSNVGPLQYYQGRLVYSNPTIPSGTNLYNKGPSLVPNNWYHAVITRISGTTYMYLNGDLITSASDSHNFSAPAVTLGNYGGGGYYGWNGKIALFRLYSGKGFSATEVLQNYNAAKNRFAVPDPVIDSNLLLNLDASNRLSFARYGGSKSYWCGGSYSNTNRTDKLLYSNDTTAAQTSANLTIARGYPVGNSDGYSKGYVSGDASIGAGATALTDKLTFSSDTTVAQTTANLSSARGAGAGASNYSTKAYVVGGWGAPSLTTADKLLFSTDASSAVSSANLSLGKSQTTSNLTDINTKGYFAGGSTNNDDITSATDKIIYSTDTTSSCTTANILVAKRNPAGLTAVSARGYVSGGYSNAATNNFDRILFASDISTALTTATLSQSRWGPNGGSEGTSKGFICGGYVTGGVATADKILYSSETCSAQASANLSLARYMPACLEEIYNTSSTSWFDTTTNNNTSTLTNGPTYDLVQPAVIFDGTNDYGAFSTSSLLNLGTAFTIEGFIKFNNLAQTVAPLFGAMDVNSGVQTKGFSFYYRSASEYGMGANCIRLQFGMAAWAWNVYASPAGSIIDNGWHHIAVSCSALNTNNPTITFYVDGVKLPTTFWNASSKTAINYSSNTDSLRVASIYYPASPGYDGPYYTNSNIANLKIFNRSLSDLEILQDYNYYVNKLSILTFTIGQTQNNPAPSGYSIKQTNPNASTGWYWLNVNGITSQFWVDMTYDGGGWVLVLNNRRNNGGMSNLTYYNATKTNVNFTGSYGLQNTPANFNMLAGLNAWKTIADETSGSNTVVMFTAGQYRTLGDTGNHSRRARFTWTGWSATYAWQGASGYTNEAGATTAGLWSYHIANGYSFSTFDVDQDAYGPNCSTLYNNNPWWYGACWDGNFFAGGSGYQDAPYWSGSAGDYYEYGAIYVR
jgi:hypothetical protein